MSSSLRNEVRSCLRSLSHEDDGTRGEFVAKFAFPEGFAGFRGHFPGMPVLPAVCQLQCALVAIGEFFGGDAVLNCVKKGRFLNVVRPCEEIELLVSVSRDADFARASVRIGKCNPSGEMAAVSRLELICTIRSR